MAKKISKIKIAIPILFAASIFAITMISFSPINASAGYGQFQIPEISGTIAITEETNDYSNFDTIALSVAMAASENSIENGKAMWGKLDVVQGFLVYKIGVLANDDVFHKTIVDAGSGSVLYVSDGVSKDNWKHSKHSDKESDKKWKDRYADLTPQEREIKKQQWSEVKEAFFGLSIDERAKMIMHFMSMKVQLESLSDDEKEAKKLEMKSMMEELLPLSVEEKTQKLREYVNSL